MNNLIKSAARKHALAHGIKTSKWTDEVFELYITEHSITAQDNLKTADELKEVAAKVELDEHIATELDAPKSPIEQALMDMMAGMKSEAKLDEGRVKQLIEQYSNAPRLTTVEIKAEGKEVKRIDGAHKQVPTLLAFIAAQVNVALVGPAGSGKSTALRMIAESLELDYYITGAVQQESKIMGYMDANGKYVRTPFRDAFEHGGLFVLEEADASAAKALLAVNNAVENESSDFPDGMVKRHEDFICVLAMNTFGTGATRQYVGRSQLDAATIDRYAVLEFGYDEALERAVALAEFDGADSWVSEVQAFRARVEAAGVRHVVSPRASKNGAKLLKQGLPLDVIRQSVLHKGLSQDQIKQLSA